MEVGHGKDDVIAPIINYSVAYDCKNAKPLYYEDYPGSIVDISQIRCALEKAEGFGYKNVAFILERGYFSKENIHYMNNCGYGFIIMMKGIQLYPSDEKFMYGRERCEVINEEIRLCGYFVIIISEKMTAVGTLLCCPKAYGFLFAASPGARFSIANIVLPASGGIPPLITDNSSNKISGKPKPKKRLIGSRKTSLVLLQVKIFELYIANRFFVPRIYISALTKRLSLCERRNASWFLAEKQPII